MITLPLRRLGRLVLDPGLRAFQPRSDGSGPVVTAMVPAADSPADRSHEWDVAWADAAREASRLGADPATADALAAGAGDATTAGTRVVVAARGQVLLARWLAPGSPGSVRVGPLPHLTEVAAAAARRPAYVVVLADRHDADVVAHFAGDHQPAERFDASGRPGAQHDPHSGRPPAQVHGERHMTDSEPESGGQRNAAFIAGRVDQAADRVGAHIVLGAGDRHVLDAVGGHLPGTIGPVTIVADTREPGDLGERIGAALDEITTAAAAAAADLAAARADGPDPGAVRGVEAVAQALAEQQVAVLLLADDAARDADPAANYRIGSRATEFLAGDPGGVTGIGGVAVPLEDGLVWAALHQDAIVLRQPDRTGPLAGQPVAALLRRGAAS
jgi:hypothetical protein